MPDNIENKKGGWEGRLTRLLPLFILLLILLFITGKYLLYGVPHEYITGEYKGTFEGDYDFTLELVKSFSQWGRLPLWSETYSGPISIFASNFHVFEQALLYPLTRSLALSIKILQTLQLLIAGLGMYYLALYLFKDRAGALFSSVLYMLTPFYIGHLLSYLHYTGVYMLAPLVYLLILRTIRERSCFHALILSPVAAYSLMSHPQNAFIGGLFYTLFFALVFTHEAFVSKGEGELGEFLKKNLPVTFTVIAATVLLSAFISIPTLIDNYPYLRTTWVKGAGAMVKADSGHIGSHSQNILSSISALHWPWFHTPLKGGEYPSWYFMPVYMMPFALSAFALLIKFNRLTLIFLVMAAASIQISLGINGSPDFFSMASRYIPFFGMSRTPYTYINSAILVFCLFSAVTFAWAADRVSERLKSRRVRWVIFFIAVLPYLFAARYYGNEYNWTFIPAKEPAYLGKVWAWMEDNNKDGGRVIETCGIPTAMLLGQKLLPNQVDLLERYHKKEYLPDYLSLLGFKYIITPSVRTQREKTFDKKGYKVPSVFDKGESMEEYYSAVTTEYSHIYQRLRSDDRFIEHDAGTRDVAIFENKARIAGYELYPGRAVMVLGGTEAYDLLGLEDFKVRGLPPAPVFIAQSENLKRLDEIATVSNDLVLHNTDALDLYIQLRKEKLLYLKPAPVTPSDWELSILSYGIQQPFPVHDHSIGNSLNGELTFSDYAITTETMGASVRNNFTVKGGGTYRVLVRAYGGRDFSSFMITVDGNRGVPVRTDSHSGYSWLAAWEGHLDSGGHNVEIANAENKRLTLDTIVVDKPTGFEAGPATALDKFKGKKVTYIANHRKFVLNGDTASANFRLGQPGKYIPSIRVARFKELKKGGSLRIYADGRLIGMVPYNDITEGIKEFRLPQTYIGTGARRIELRGMPEGLFFDLIAFSAGVETAVEKPSFSFQRTGPSSYAFESRSSGPALLVFNETNYPGWSMKTDGKAERPLVANMFMNGFIIPGGSQRGEISYSNGRQRAGLIISGITLAGICIILPFLRKRK